MHKTRESVDKQQTSQTGYDTLLVAIKNRRLKEWFYYFQHGHPFLLKEEADIIVETRLNDKTSKWMNKIFLGLLTLLLASCQKEEESSSYAGEYSGTWEYSTPYFHKENMAAYRNIVENESELLVTTNWSTGELQTALPNGNGYSYRTFEILANNSCQMQFVTITGNGRFVGDSLFEEGTLTFVTDNCTYKGTWNSKLKKQN